MTITRRNPADLHLPPGYHHVTISQPGTVAHLAGQCPIGADGDLVGADDLLAQTDQVVRNAMIALSDAGSTPADVVRSVVYVASSDGADLSAVWDRLRESPLADALTTASTLLGVTCLGFTGQLVEVDLTAMVSETAE